MPAVQRLVGNEIEETRISVGRAVNKIERLGCEFHAIGAATRNRQAMRDVRGQRIPLERLERAANGNALIDLPHRGVLELVAKLGLADEHELQKLLRSLEIGEDADLLEQRRRKILRLVDDQHRIRLQRNERSQKVVQRIAELRPRRGVQPSALHIVDRHHAELDEQHLQQVFARHKRVGHERAEGFAVERREHAAAERGLARTRLARQDDDAFAAPNARAQLVEHGRMRRGSYKGTGDRPKG